jgi:hypothetical protein
MFKAQAIGRHPGRFSLLRFIRGGRRPPRLHISELPEALRRDLGFADGHISPPRDPLRD